MPNKNLVSMQNFSVLKKSVPEQAKNYAPQKPAARAFLVQSTISTLTFWPVRWATDLMIVRISLAMRP